MKQADLSSYLVHPNPDNGALTSQVTGRDHTGADVDVDVVTERGLTVYLNKQEIVTLMTLGDHPQYLAVGFLLNQNMLQADDVTKYGALSAARRAYFFLHFIFVISFTLSAHYGNF